MALWECKLNLIPNNKISIHFLKNMYLDIEFINGIDFDKDLYKEINNYLINSNILKKSDSWNEIIKLWSLGENSLSLIVENGILYEIILNFDLRYIDKLYEFVLYIIKLSLHFDLSIYDKNLKIIKNNYSEIIKFLKESEAFNFVSDPHLFLSKLKIN